MKPLWQRIGAGIRDLNPAYFALVMATGIVSTAMHLDNANTLSGVLLGVGIIAYVILAVAYAARFVRYRKEFLADTVNPRRAFGFFTFTAASDVLGARLASDGHQVWTAVLLGIAGAGWLLLIYSVPVLVASRNQVRPALASANGTWFLCVVATQSIAVAATSFHPRVPDALAALAICCWAVGVVLYLIVAVMVTTALLQYPVRAADLTPPYWVFMGATAISVLAAGQILRLPHAPLEAAVHEVVSGISLILWAFGTWLIPLLLLAGAWRHLVQRVPLRYDPGLWSIVFPVGMYGVASRQLGAALGVSWLVTLGRVEAWVALGVWAAVVLAMGAAFAKQAPGPAAPAASGPAASGPAASRLHTVVAGTTASRGRRKRSAERKARARRGMGSSAVAADA
jgi:tellurite resistance protein TehA-like permease